MDNWKTWEELGQRWIKGEVTIADWQGKKLNPKQIAYVNAKDRFVLLSGGMAGGKTLAFLIKLCLLSLFFPGNRILLGRKTRSDVERATLPDFYDVAPEGSFEYKVGPGMIKFGNGSEIILFGLDASASGIDTKKAEQQIKSLNLGAFFIDQVEEIEKSVFTALTARLRRNVGFQQGNMTCNPANFWGLDYFKLHPAQGTRLIETSMLDNKANLPPGYVEHELTKPKLWVQKYVYGEWSTELLSEHTVFSQDYVNEQRIYAQPEIRRFNGVHIFKEPDEKHEYQIGVDASDASVDPCGIVCVDKHTGEVVATYNEWVPVEQQVEIAVWMGYRYNQALIVPEAAPSAAGAAFTQELKKRYNKIYIRKSTQKIDDQESGKLGFLTSHSSKTMLIEHMKVLMEKHYPKIRDQRILSELNTFAYTDEARQKGAGAQAGFHDDLLFATLLAYWEMEPRSGNEAEKIQKQWSQFQLYGTRYN